MSRIFVHGLGAVSPAGWGVPALGAALKKGEPLAAQPVKRPVGGRALRALATPPPASPPPFLCHPRLRRTSPIAQYTVATAWEALGDDVPRIKNGEMRLGVIVCLMLGCVAYSRRFFEETLASPETASPLIFPETVFNAPASHLSACLNSPSVNYTIVGDNGTFLQGVALAADWLENGRADACVVVAAEECDWIASNAMRLFRRGLTYSGGGGALYLKMGQPSPVELTSITDSFLYSRQQSPAEAGRKMQAQLPELSAGELFCVSGNEGGNRPAGLGVCLKPAAVLGDSFVALAAWQCVAACDLIQKGTYNAANISVLGANQQAIGARFVRNRE